MQNSIIEQFKRSQITKMFEGKKSYNINMTKNKFYAGDAVAVTVYNKDEKGVVHAKNYPGGLVIKGNTHKTSANVFSIDESKIDEYITIGHFMNQNDKLSYKVYLNDPRIHVTLIRSATYKNGAKVRGTGRSNKTKNFCDDKQSSKKIRMIFKNHW